MKKFAFIFHPHDLEFYADGFTEPDLKNKNPDLIKNAMRWFPPFKRSTVTGIKSVSNNKEVEGIMILVSLIPEHIKNLSDEFALAKFIEAAKLSEKMGAQIIGLGAYASLYGRHGVDLAAAVKIPVTTGNTYTLAVTPDVILKILGMRNKDLLKTKVSILGATGILGSYCLRSIIGKIGEINLLSSNYKRLEDLAILKGCFSTKINSYFVQDNPRYLYDSDLILVANAKYAPLVKLDKLKKGVVVYDATFPKSFIDGAPKSREDILFIDGGVILPPGNTDFHFSFGFPKSVAFPCMAETMILALEEIFEPYSLGRIVDFNKAKKIYALGNKHGFKLVGFSHKGKMLTNV